jgi:hypothetical protein
LQADSRSTGAGELGLDAGHTRLGAALGAAFRQGDPVQVQSACVSVALMRLTANCDRALPTREEPLRKSILTPAPKMMPCIDAFARISAKPVTCQKMFSEQQSERIAHGCTKLVTEYWTQCVT